MIKTNNKLKISAYKIMERRDYDSFAIIYDNAIEEGKNHPDDCLLAKVDIRFSVNEGIPVVVLIIENKLVPVTFSSINRKLIKEHYGSVIGFLKQFNLIFKQTGIVDIKPKLVNGSIGMYSVINIKENGFDLMLNGKLVQHYAISQINELKYRGPEFKFIRNIIAKNTNDLSTLYSMSEEDFNRVFSENRFEDYNSEKDIAILIPQLPDNIINNRKLKKQNQQQITNPTLPRTLNRYPWTTENASMNIAISAAYCEWYRKNIVSNEG